MMVGLQGSGKTTTATKLARRLDREGRRPLLAALDVRRPAAIDQLETLAAEVDVPVFSDRETQDVPGLAERALEHARAERHRVLILDSAGRLQIDLELMDELRRVRGRVEPVETLLVADAMTGQEAVRIAEGFHEAVGLTGVVLTKLDGDARGGAALSIRAATGVPIKFAGVGERPQDLDVFDPARMADRLLQRGDVVGLVERAQQTFDQQKTEKLQRKFEREGKFDLDDYLVAMDQMQKLGPLESILGMLPGVGKALKGIQIDPKKLKHVEGGDHPVDDARRASPAEDPGRVAAQADRARVGAVGAGGQPPDQAVRTDAAADEAAEEHGARRDGRRPLRRRRLAPGHADELGEGQCP